MLAQGLIWIHEWVANGGVLDLLLTGDTNVCATIGFLVGGVIGCSRLGRQDGNESNG